MNEENRPKITFHVEDGKLLHTGADDVVSLEDAAEMLTHYFKIQSQLSLAQQQNEIYRVALEYYSNETYMKERPQVPYWDIGNTATKALQDAQKLEGGK